MPDKLQLRLKALPGTRIDRTKAMAKQALDIVGKEGAGPGNMAISIGYVGITATGICHQRHLLWTSGPEEAVMQVTVQDVALEPFKERLRQRLARTLPQMPISFHRQTSSARVMSFGAFTPIEIDVSGPSLDAGRRACDEAAGKPAQHLGFAGPANRAGLRLSDGAGGGRSRTAGQLGVTKAQVTDTVVAATSSSRFGAELLGRSEERRGLPGRWRSRRKPCAPSATWARCRWRKACY